MQQSTARGLDGQILLKGLSSAAAAAAFGAGALAFSLELLETVQHTDCSFVAGSKRNTLMTCFILSLETWISLLRAGCIARRLCLVWHWVDGPVLPCELLVLMAAAERFSTKTSGSEAANRPLCLTVVASGAV